MSIDDPILEIGVIKAAPTPATGAQPACLIVEVRTPTSKAQFVDLLIARDAIGDLVSKLSNFLNDPDVLTNPNILKP